MLARERENNKFLSELVTSLNNVEPSVELHRACYCTYTSKKYKRKSVDGHVPEAGPGRSTLNVLNYKYKYFPPRKYLSTSTVLFGEMYLSTFRVLSKCT